MHRTGIAPKPISRRKRGSSAGGGTVGGSTPLQSGLFGTSESDLVERFEQAFLSPELAQITDVSARFRAAFRRVCGRPQSEIPSRTLAAMWVSVARMTRQAG